MVSVGREMPLRKMKFGSSYISEDTDYYETESLTIEDNGYSYSTDRQA